MFTLLTSFGNVRAGNPDNEIDLIKRIQARDAKALEELYELYKELLFGMILSIVKIHRKAEDILRETFIAVWNKADSFNPNRGNVYGWLVVLARNKAIHHIRQKQSDHTGEPFSFIEVPEHDPMETTIFSDRSELVKQALDKIPDKESEAIKMAYQRGLKQSEIAGYLNLPLGTINNRIRSGMIKLKQNVKKFIASDG